MDDIFISAEDYRTQHKEHWDSVAKNKLAFFSRQYLQRSINDYKTVVNEGLKVLEVGCGRGDLLAALKPSVGVGIDLSGVYIEQAKEKHSNLEFHCSSIEEWNYEGCFDVIVCADLVNDLYDVQDVFRVLKKWCHAGTKVVVGFYNNMWRPVIQIAKALGLARANLPQNWIAPDDIGNMLYLTDFEIVSERTAGLIPLNLPIICPLCNRFLVKVLPFSAFAYARMIVARLRPGLASRLGEYSSPEDKPSISVIVAARNEEGNIYNIFKRFPEFPGESELIFVEGGSSDDTWGEVERRMKYFPHIKCSLHKQQGKGKGDAVRLGFAVATCDIVTILDADLTMPPEYLPKFYNALVSEHGEFINGVRLVYPLGKKSMRFFNIIGNKFFSMAFSWLLSQPIKDTLCGTKMMWKRDYDKIAAARTYFGDFDPFGDFDLIFGAAKQQMKIVDLPIRYKERIYGNTNISRWKHGVILLRMVIFAAFKIKFV